MYKYQIINNNNKTNKYISINKINNSDELLVTLHDIDFEIDISDNTKYVKFKHTKFALYLFQVNLSKDIFGYSLFKFNKNNTVRILHLQEISENVEITYDYDFRNNKYLIIKFNNIKSLKIDIESLKIISENIINKYISDFFDLFNL